MDGREIKHLIQQDEHLRQKFRGVYARDALPNGGRIFSGFFIINTANSSSTGKHWTAALKWTDNDDTVFFYDSMGKAPSYYDITFPGHKHIVFNAVCVQSNTSILCGLYCIHFLYLSTRGLNMQDILSCFENDTSKNDEIKKFSLY